MNRAELCLSAGSQEALLLLGLRPGNREIVKRLLERAAVWSYCNRTHGNLNAGVRIP